MSSQPSLPHGEFEITEASRDVFRSLYATLGAVAAGVLLMWLVCVVLAVRSVMIGEAPNVAAFMIAVFGATWLFMMLRSGRGASSRSWTIRLSDEGITARRETGELTLFWRAINRVEDRGGMLVMFAGRLAVVLPVYRMSDVQVASIRGCLAATPNYEQIRKRSRVRFVALWVLMVLWFVALYNLMQP
jgi:hypothetical protein